MVNNYNLELELLRRSKVTDRSPKSIMDKPNYYIDYLDDSPWIHMPYEKYETMKPEEIV